MDNVKTWTGLPVEESARVTEDRDNRRKYVHLHSVANQMRNHVFKVERSNFLVWGITALLQNFFRKVYPVWRCRLPPPDPHQKLRKKLVRSVQLSGGRDPRPPVVAPMWPTLGSRTANEQNTIQCNTKFVKRHVAVASEALANRTVKKHRRRRTNVL